MRIVRIFFIFITFMATAVYAANKFSGVRFNAGIGLTRHYMAIESGPNFAFFAPTISGSLTAGRVLSNQSIYCGVHTFAHIMHGKEIVNKWHISPHYDYGLGVIFGSVVEDFFLTSIALGLKRAHYDTMYPYSQKVFEEKVPMMFFGIKTEGALTNRISSEVSYQYALALSQNPSAANVQYRQRTSMHIFSLGICIKL